LTNEDLKRRVAEIRWFHQIDLGDGVTTPGHDESAAKLRKLRLPARFDGQTVLDIGSWDGFFAFEAERRGAQRVVAMDPACWRPPAWGPRGWGTQQGFRLAHEVLGSRVEPLDIGLPDISPETIGTFDVVFFLGVFYHLPNPWLVLERAASVCRHLLVVETHADLLDHRRAAMAFYPGDEMEGDPSNYWGPNSRALAGMLGAEGFRKVDVYGERRGLRLARAGYRRLRGTRYSPQQGRLVAHAWR
jgi:tRNA (mo5U34)-methyltransferase